MANTVTVSGMFGTGLTYFADSPVVIDISGLEWPESSPFTIVRVEVIYNDKVVGDFRADTGGQPSINFDISSALRAIWFDYDFQDEISDANVAAGGDTADGTWVRSFLDYSLRIYTEYIASYDGGVFTTTGFGPFTGGRCAMGGMTEWERRQAIKDRGDKANADVSYHEHENNRNGDASTKPTSSPERVGRHSITSWVDVSGSGTQSIFYPASANGAADSAVAHAPLVLRDSQPYVDFLFVNRRGAVETCSAVMKEGMEIEVDTQQYSRVERPSFAPNRSLMAISRGGRRSWSMSSGGQTREWAEWWVQEFLRSRQWWMRYPIDDAAGAFVPVVVSPAKKNTGIYDRAKQTMPSVEFTVTMAIEG